MEGTFTVNPTDVALLIKLLSADAMSQKIIEWGSTAVVGTLGVGWGAQVFKSAKEVYGQLRAMGTDTLFFLSGLAGGTVSKIARGTATATTTATTTAKKGEEVLKETERKVSPLSSSPDFFKETVREGVGEGRRVRASDIVEGRVGSSQVLSVQVGDRLFATTEDGRWVEKVGDEFKEVSKEDFKSILESPWNQQEATGVASLKVRYAGGDEAVLHRQKDGTFLEKLPVSVLEDPEKVSHRLSGDVVLNAHRSSPTQIANTIQNLPATAKVVVKGVGGGVAFKKLENGRLKLYTDYGLARKDDEILRLTYRVNTGKMNLDDFVKELRKKTTTPPRTPSSTEVDKE